MTRYQENLIYLICVLGIRCVLVCWDGDRHYMGEHQKIRITFDIHFSAARVVADDENMSIFFCSPRLYTCQEFTHSPRSMISQQEMDQIFVVC